MYIMNEQLYNWTFNFQNVVWQQIWGEVTDFITASFAVHLRMQQWKKIIKIIAKVITKGVRVFFWLVV